MKHEEIKTCFDFKFMPLKLIFVCLQRNIKMWQGEECKIGKKNGMEDWKKKWERLKMSCVNAKWILSRRAVCKVMKVLWLEKGNMKWFLQSNWEATHLKKIVARIRQLASLQEGK